MTDRESTAIEAGKLQAQQVLEFRRERHQARRRAMEAAAHRAARSSEQPVFDEDVPAELSSESSEVLLAEGDSWFDYPWNDVLSELEDEHGYQIEAVSHRGDRIEEMAYSGGQLNRFTRALEKLIGNGKAPKAILISGGGNDIAGNDFAILLNHYQSPAPGLNEQIVSGILDERIRLAYITILSAMTRICENHLGAAVPILIHGYDYSVPDGRGFWGGWGPLPGPWLDPGFRAKGYEDPGERLAIVRQLIDRFNDVLMDLPNLPELEHVTHVELRGTLKTDHTYTDWWDNELHPTADGFEAVARKFAEELEP